MLNRLITFVISLFLLPFAALSQTVVTPCTSMIMSTNASGSLGGTNFAPQLVEFNFPVPMGTQVVTNNPGGEYQSAVTVPAGSMTVRVGAVTTSVTSELLFSEGFAPGYVNLIDNTTNEYLEILFSDEIGVKPFETNRDVDGDGTVGDWTNANVQTANGRLILNEPAGDPRVRFAVSGCMPAPEPADDEQCFVTKGQNVSAVFCL